MQKTDLLIIGAGPAGMSAAIEARAHGLDVVVVDDQAMPGGQIWRSVEATRRRDEILGPSYTEGREIAAAFHASGARYLANTQLWQLEPGYRAFVTQSGAASAIESTAIMFATGAQERPVPFPGWTLPGVMTVGAAQILLKSCGQVPMGKVWIAGCGPLPLLYATQFLRAGGTLAGYLNTAPKGQWKAAARHLPAALRASSDLLKGLAWRSRLKRSGTPIFRVAHLEAVGDDQLRGVRFGEDPASTQIADGDVLLIHEGVVPSIHPMIASGCRLQWDRAQLSYRPVTDCLGETSRTNLFVAGDGAGIAGAKAAILRGRLAAVGVAVKLGRLEAKASMRLVRPLRRKLARELAIRPFLDAMFKPRQQILVPGDDTIICRCEEISAGTIRSAAAIGCPGPNQVKAATRAGMGPCQGRQCGYSITNILCETQKRAPSDVGFLNIRPPLKPVSLGELATLDPGESH